MKFSNALWASALLAGAASASAHHRRHAHHPLRRDLGETCLPQCTTYVTSYLVDVEEPTKVVPPPVVETVVVTPVVVLPTPEVTTCPTPGTYTIPAKTVIVTETTAVCVPETTQVPPGTHTVGGVTTVVETATTVVCPVAAVETNDGTVTHVVKTTTFVCPTPGTYTIGPQTTVVPTETVVVYPVVSVVKPGTYCHEAVTTIIHQTNVVVTCPLTTVEATATVVPVIETSPPQPKVEKKPAPEPVEAVEEPSGEAPAPGGDHWAITYSPYNDDKSCKVAGDVDADIKDIASKGFKAIRLYSPECDSLKTVGTACRKYNLKIILGVFIRAGGPSTADKEVDEICAWKQWDLVTLFVVGNECIFNGHCGADQLAGYIKAVSAKVKGSGYKGQVTTAEPVNIIEANAGALCSAIDVVGVNIHPFFDGGVPAEGAGDFLKKQMQRVESLCKKPAYVLEAGWPNAGNSNGVAIASPDAQAKAINSIRNAVKDKICFFTYRKDGWKQGGPLNVEPNFGCGRLF